ncbi:MAG: hypothetical protein HZR80_18945 [Candidatus Heimdallarchaeota archaeon]
MVETWRLSWETYDFVEGLKEGFKKKYHWYMIFMKKGLGLFSYPELMYIGMTKRTVSERLLSKHDALISSLRDFKDRNIILGLGFLSSRKQLTPTTLKYIESAMIAKFKPRLNASGVTRFVPKGNIKIISEYPEDSGWEILNWEI